DAEHRDLLDSVVRDAVGKGATVLLASHELDRARALAGRVVSMAGGVVQGPSGPLSGEQGPSGPAAAPVAGSREAAHVA
ncbi:MAG: hypothetical protein ACRDXE_05670, partial [Acidimicrobiales bacterium]